MANVAVIGAGPMGLAAALDLLKQGHAVTVYEADKVIGGMSASFDFEGQRIERFYHFICTGDQPYFDLLGELGIADQLRWTTTRMGYYRNGALADWGNPVALLRFPGLGLMAKLRYGLLALEAVHRRNWQSLDARDAVEWIGSRVGPEAYEVLWRQLFELKFHQFTPNLSAAWIWARMRRMGTSRSSLMHERLGYLEGGTDTFLDAIAAAILAAGGSIRTNSRVDEVLIDRGRIRGVRVGADAINHEAIISTVPLPFVPRLIPALAPDRLAAYRALDNIAVVCVLAHLARPLSPYFWLNVSDASMDIPGLVEYTNLRPMSGHIVYVPYYLPGDSSSYNQPDEWFLQRARQHLFRINPGLQDSDILAIRAGRYRYAQPICPPGFPARLPPVATGVEGLLVADTSHYYPEDRSISESVKLGRELARTLRA